MKKKSNLIEQKATARPMSGRFTPREASPHAKVATKKPQPKKTRYVTPNPFSATKGMKLPRECKLNFITLY